MRIASSVLSVAVLGASASAGLSSAMIDDFSGIPGLGFVRSASGGASVAGGAGLLPAGGGFTWGGPDSGTNAYDASAFSGISMKVTGALSGGELQISVFGSDYSSLLMNVNVSGNINASTGYLWVTFAELDASDWGPVNWSSVGAIGFGLVGGTGSVQVDDLEFRSSAVIPAPGALALVGMAGVARSRRRR